MFAAITPRGRLGLLVERIWTFVGLRAGTGVEWRLPTGRAELVFNLAADRFELADRDRSPRRYPGAVLVGPSARPFALGVAQQGHVLGVVFRAGGARAVLGLPMHEVAGRHVPLSDLWGEAATRLRERLLVLPGAIQRLAEVERELEGRVVATGRAAHPMVVGAIAELSRDPGPGPTDIADRVGFSQRRVEQVFRAEVGLAPDVCRRLARFRTTLRLIDRAAEVGWAGFALERGYCDQSHLIGEFRAHAAVSPVAYLRVRGPALNHVPAVSG